MNTRPEPTTQSGNHLSKIGIGSYGIGGKGHRDVQLTNKDLDSKYIDALTYTLNQGINFTEISLGYGHGQSLSLFKKSLDQSNTNRHNIFLTHSLYPRDLPNLGTIKEDINSFYQVMKTDYADSTLVTQDFIMKFGESTTYKTLNQLLQTGRTKYVSLSNASPTWIKNFIKEFGNKIFAHEGHLSFEVRALQDKGVFDLCRKSNITNVIWRPLRQNRTQHHNWPLLVELATKYGKTQNQIVLNWITNLGYKPMVMAANKPHINENLNATKFNMTEEDYKLITNFRIKPSQPIVVDWEGPNGGNDIVALANQPYETF